MAQIDIRECTIKLFDGTLGTYTFVSAADDADLSFTAKSKHIGSDKITVTISNPGTALAPLAVTVVGRDITISLETDNSGTPAVISTAAEVKTAVEALAAAHALVTVAYANVTAGDGSGAVDVFTKTALSGQKSISVKIGEGNLTYSEKRPVEFIRDRGAIDTVKNADEEPMDLSFDIMWEWISTEHGATATVEDALKRLNDAHDWASTADDDCQPYCVDVELWNAPGCGSLDDELIVFEEFYYETLDHDVREGTVSAAGRCNRTVATPRRVAHSDVA